MEDPFLEDIAEVSRALDTTLSLLATGGTEARVLGAALYIKALTVWRKAGYADEEILAMIEAGLRIPADRLAR